jgi:GNAT superfamily N-acetyltransferase
MKRFGNLAFDPFTEGDVGTIAPIMKRAFDADTQMHTGKPAGGPPGYDDGSFLKQWALHPESVSWRILSEGSPIGAVIVWPKPSGEHFLGCLFVDPAYQGKGLGLTAWRFIESEYPDAIRWSTETIATSRRNHYFYVNKCGFRIVRVDGTGDEAQYVMEKVMKG